MVANIEFQPIIDMNPGNESYLYSTLLSIDKEAQCLKTSVTCITFSQRLWLRADEISLADDLGDII